jgi:DNA polymerase III subunit alpha
MAADFTHLHVHSQFSLLDSTIRLEGLLQAAHDDKMEAVALTDHGNMFGALDFYLKAKEFGIKPILGCEMYVAPQSRLMRGTHTSGDDELAPYSTAKSGMSHLNLLVQNEIGYLNLCKLVSSGFLEGFYYKPRIDKEILAKHTEGLIATSACLKGEVTNFCVLGDMDRARAAAIWYRDLFQGRFYLEVQQNNLPQQMMVNERFQQLSRDLGIPLIATADCHYLKKEQAPMQEVLMAIQTGRNLDEGGSSGLKSDEFYFKPQNTMKEEWHHLPEAISNTMEIAHSCKFEFQFNDEKGKKIYHFPKFDPPGGIPPQQFLRELSAKGLEDRLQAKYSKNEKITRTPEADKPYLDRLSRELDVIIEMGFTGYFLIVADFIGYGKSHGIPVGPGRGSGAGSLVAYVLGITDLDPLEHGLIFERFLNPERVSLPDFDVDFCMDKRDKVIEYVSQKYGKDCVSQIITFGKLQARGVIRDVGRTFGIPAVDVDKIAKLVPETINITLDEAFEQEPRLRALTEQDRRLAHLFEVCRTLEGLPRHASIHAAGLVISNRPMVEHCALTRGKNDELVIQLDMNNADRIGLIKFDFLGLKTLTFLQRAEELIHKRHPHSSFSLVDIDITDKTMYEMLTRGDTLGVFQLESSGMQDLMKKVKPDCFEDIVASNALYRPGPLESGMVDDFINRKHGHTQVTYDFEELRPILHETYGVIVYQEQVQQVAMTLASYTAGAADLLRRAMGKKKPEEMAKQKEKFVSGARAKGFNADKIDHLFELMAKFAGYGFNKSHAAAYSLITCQTAYIKAHYQVEFFAALLSIERENTDKITKYIADAARHGIVVLPPHINESETDFTVLSEKEIRFGLGAIKGVGQIAIDSVLEARKSGGPFKDLYDLCARTNNRTCNKRVVEAFVKAGALDGFQIHRASLFKAIDPALEAGASIQKQRDQNQVSFLDLFGEGESDDSFSHRTVTYPDADRWERLQELKYEKDTIGFFVSGHPLDDFQNELNRYTTTTIAECVQAQRSRDIMVGATVAGLREFITRRGDRMAFATLQDRSDEIDAVVFSDLYLEAEELLKGDEPIWIKGTLERSDNSSKIILSKKKGNAKILSLRYAYEALGREIHIHLNSGGRMPQDRVSRFRALLDSTKDVPGVPVYLHVQTNAKADAVMRVKGSLPLKRDLVHSIRSLFEGDGVNIEFR